MKKDLNIKGRAYYQNLRTKFLASAKEAASSGDRILSEYNLQIAEHYARIISERFGNQREPRQFQERIGQNTPDRGDKKSNAQNLDKPPERYSPKPSEAELPQGGTKRRIPGSYHNRRILPKSPESELIEVPKRESDIPKVAVNPPEEPVKPRRVRKARTKPEIDAEGSSTSEKSTAGQETPSSAVGIKKRRVSRNRIRPVDDKREE
jgi:hypothetical protein